LQQPHKVEIIISMQAHDWLESAANQTVYK